MRLSFVIFGLLVKLLNYLRHFFEDEKRERISSLIDTSQLKNDWSNNSDYLGNEYFSKVETLLDSQLKFENETREKCQEIVKERNIKNNIIDIEDRLREYDEQISLNLLLKKNKDYTSPQHHHNSASNLNLKDMRGPHCERCTEKNRYRIIFLFLF